MWFLIFYQNKLGFQTIQYFKAVTLAFSACDESFVACVERDPAQLREGEQGHPAQCRGSAHLAPVPSEGWRYHQRLAIPSFSPK